MILVIYMLWRVSTIVSRWLQQWMPWNRAITHIRARHSLGWVFGTQAVAATCFLLGHLADQAIRGGATGWLHLVVMFFCWQGLRFMWLGPICLRLLARQHWNTRRHG